MELGDFTSWSARRLRANWRHQLVLRIAPRSAQASDQMLIQCCRLVSRVGVALALGSWTGAQPSPDDSVSQPLRLPAKWKVQ